MLAKIQDNTVQVTLTFEEAKKLRELTRFNNEGSVTVKPVIPTYVEMLDKLKAIADLHHILSPFDLSGKIELTKKYRTVSGDKVKLLDINPLLGVYSVVGYIYVKDATSPLPILSSWTIKGIYGSNDKGTKNLVEVIE